MPYTLSPALLSRPRTRGRPWDFEGYFGPPPGLSLGFVPELSPGPESFGFREGPERLNSELLGSSVWVQAQGGEGERGKATGH